MVLAAQSFTVVWWMFEHTFFFVLFLAHHIRWIFGFSFDVKNLFRHKSARLDPNYSLEGQTSNSKKCPKDFGAAISAIHTVVFNMICGLSMTRSHPTKITKWPHILVIPLVGSPKPRTKSKNPPTHPGTEKREAKVVILGDFRGGLRVLFHRFQTWACGYEEI